MSSYDPIWLAMVLGAQARLRPPSHIIVHHGDRDPEKAYLRLKQTVRRIAPIDVDILDIGPRSAERRQILADSLRQHQVGADPHVRRWANLLLESVLKYSPQTIMAAGFNVEDIRNALQASGFTRF